MSRFSVVFLASVISLVMSQSEEEKCEIMDILMPVTMSCISDCGIPKEDYEIVKQSDKSLCYKTCFLKTIGLLNADGTYMREIARDLVLAYLDNEEEADKVQSALDECFRKKAKSEAFRDDYDAEMRRVNFLYNCLKNFKCD